MARTNKSMSDLMIGHQKELKRGLKTSLEDPNYDPPNPEGARALIEAFDMFEKTDPVEVRGRIILYTKEDVGDFCFAFSALAALPDPSVEFDYYHWAEKATYLTVTLTHGHPHEFAKTAPVSQGEEPLVFAWMTDVFGAERVLREYSFAAYLDVILCRAGEGEKRFLLHSIDEEDGGEARTYHYRKGSEGLSLYVNTAVRHLIP